MISPINLPSLDRCETNTRHGLVIDYINCGFALIPIPLGEKGPKKSRWNILESAITTHDATTDLSGNIGLAHAFCTPSPTCAIDLDDLERASKWLQQKGLDINALLNAKDAVQIKSGKPNRAKLLYRLPEGRAPIITTTVRDRAGMILEFRCASPNGKTTQDVLPPSTHPETKKPYIWAGLGIYKHLPTIPSPLLEIWLTLLQKKNRGKEIITKEAVGKKLTPKGQKLEDLGESETTVATLDRLQSALSSIPSNIERETWRSIIFSIKAHGLDRGEEIARKWSMSAGQHEPTTNPNGYDEIAFQNIWRYESRDIKEETLYFHARNHNWVWGNSRFFSARTDLFGDIKNGKVFAEMFVDKMLYAYSRGRWLFWDETRWAWCDSGQQINASKNCAIEIADRAASEFAKDPSNPDTKKAISHANATQNLRKLEAMLVCGAAEKDMGISSIDALDSDPYLLGCKNGVIDLKTSELLTPTPSMLITRQFNANYYNESDCPLWKQFLAECFVKDLETVDTIQRALGYTLTGSVKEEKLFFCFGFGRNGKSVFSNVLTQILGDYGITAPAAMLMRRERDSATNDFARLAGARYVSANETRTDHRLDDLTLKSLVSTERMTARYLHQEFFQFSPTFKLWVRGNHKPIITDDTEGAWRRIILIPFENNVPNENIDPFLEEKLLRERDGILTWMVQGALLWQESGLALSKRILSATKHYRDESDNIGEWLREFCVIRADFKARQDQVWQCYKSFCFRDNLAPGSKKTFTRKLAERQIGGLNYIGKHRAYMGIKLNEVALELLGLSDSTF